MVTLVDAVADLLMWVLMSLARTTVNVDELKLPSMGTEKATCNGFMAPKKLRVLVSSVNFSRSARILNEAFERSKSIRIDRICDTLEKSCLTHTLQI